MNAKILKNICGKHSTFASRSTIGIYYNSKDIQIKVITKIYDWKEVLITTITDLFTRKYAHFAKVQNIILCKYLEDQRTLKASI